MPFNHITLSMLQAALVLRWDSSPFWTPEHARLAINEGLREYNLLTGVWKRRIVIPTMANQVWYTLPSTMVYRMRIEWNQHPLDPTSTFELDQMVTDWESKTTASGGSTPATPRFWIPKGLTLLGIYPADATSTNSLVIDGVRQTPVLVGPGDRLDLSESEEDAILNYALHAVSYAQGAAVLRRTWPHYRQFLQACVSHNSRLLASQFFREVLGLDQGRRLKHSHDPTKPSSIVQQILQTVGTTAPVDVTE